MARTIGVQFAIGAAMTSTVASTFATVDTKVKSLGKNLKELQTISAKAGALTTADLSLKAAKSQHAINSTEKHTTALKKAELAYRTAQRNASKYNITVGESAAVHAKANTAIARTQSSLERQQRFQVNASKRSELQGQMLGTAATFAAVAIPIHQAIAFESSFADVKKVVDFGSPDEEKGAQKDIRDLSARTGLSAEGIARIYASAGEARIATTREELQAFATNAATMAVAFGISAEDAGAKMTAWQSKMGMSQAEVLEMADAINHLGNNMAAPSAKTAAIVESMGAVAKSAGLSGKSIAALSATFVASSKSPEVAATGMKNFLLALTKGEQMSGTQKDIMARLGFDPKSLAHAMQEDAEGTITSVMEALSGMDKAEQSGALAGLFGSESVESIQPLLTNMDLLKDAFSLVANEAEYTGSMQKEYEVRSNTTEAAIKRLRATAQSLGITIGSVVLPAVASVAQGMITLLQPVIWLAETFPLLTQFAFGTVAALVTLKVVALGAAYAGTILSDGWNIGKKIMDAMRLSTIRQNAALVKQRVLTLAGAAATKVVTIAQWAWNAATLANPLGFMLVVVAGVGAAIAWLARKCEFMVTIFSAIGKGWETVKGWFGVGDTEGIELKATATTEAISTQAIAMESIPTITGVPTSMQSSIEDGMPMPNMSQSYGASPSISSQINLSVTMNGVPNKDAGASFMESIKSQEPELQKYFTNLLNRIVSEQGRLSYG